MIRPPPISKFFPSTTLFRSVAEAMVALVLADAVLEKFGGDSVAEVARNLEAYLEAVPQMQR